MLPDPPPAWPSRGAGQPYFGRWDEGERPSYGPQLDDTQAGTYGLKKSYVQNNPAVIYAPMLRS